MSYRRPAKAMGVRNDVLEALNTSSTLTNIFSEMQLTLRDRLSVWWHLKREEWFGTEDVDEPPNQNPA